jgi:hypothetical protein
VPDASQSLLQNVPPGMDPIEYAKMVRQQQIAELAMNAATTPISVQQPQGSNRGFYQAARVSPVSGLAKLAEAMIAKKGMDQSAQNQAEMYARGLQAFSPNGGPPQPPPAAPADSGPQGGYSGGAGANDAGQPGSTVAPVRPSVSTPNPLNPTALPAKPLFDLYRTDPAKYLDMIKGTPEWQTTLAAYGGNVTAAQAAIKAKMTKEGALEMRSGGETGIPDPTAPGGYRFIRTPNLGPNQEYTRDANGNVVETHLIPGAATAEQQQEQAKKTGENQGEIHTLPTAGGGSRVQFGIGGIAGAPPSAPPAAAPPAAGPPPPRYFPPIPGSPGAAPTPAAAAPKPGAPAVPPNAPGAPPSAPPGVTPGIWRGVPQRPNTSAIGEDPYIAGTVKKMVDKNDELSTKYGSEADLADQRIAFNNEALKVLSTSSTGPLSDKITALKKRAVEMGVPAGWLWGGDPNSTDELKKFLLRNPLLSLKPTFGGRPAASEFQILANDASPSPQMLSGAIQRLVQLDNQAAGFSKQRATDYAYYHDHQNGNPTRFESYYANKVPFAKWLDQNPQGREGEAHIDTRPPLSSFVH